jgi:hypothetical protein
MTRLLLGLSTLPYRHRNSCWSVITPGRPCDCRGLDKAVAAMAAKMLPEVERLIEQKNASASGGSPRE